MRRLLVVTTVLAGCLNSQNYLDKSVVVSCKKLQQCVPSTFSSRYDSQSTCQSQVQAYYQSWGMYDCISSCTFDEKQARKCLSATRSMSCSDYSKGSYDSSCGQVYSCDATALQCLSEHQSSGDTGDTG
jgi:hypothetical protein